MNREQQAIIIDVLTRWQHKYPGLTDTQINTLKGRMILQYDKRKNIASAVYVVLAAWMDNSCRNIIASKDRAYIEKEIVNQFNQLQHG